MVINIIKSYVKSNLINDELLQYWTSINNKVRDGNVKDCMEIWSEINKWYRIDKN